MHFGPLKWQLCVSILLVTQQIDCADSEKLLGHNFKWGWFSPQIMQSTTEHQQSAGTLLGLGNKRLLGVKDIAL